ncbi:MAG: pyruvoyl-dependent arginine decarboxylase [Candidatus Saccharimonadales bacterium]
MIIYVSKAVGCATTALGAIDNALYKAGVHNFNLIRLSSVLPKGAEVQHVERYTPSENFKWGDKLYLVYASQTAVEKGERAVAGIAWARSTENGEGIFVEQEGNNYDQVHESLEQSLRDLFTTRGLTLDETSLTIDMIEGVVEDKPICAFVSVAVEEEGWKGIKTHEK